MKSNITISVDVDVIVRARQKLGNISAFLNGALKAVADLPDAEITNNVDELRAIIASRSAELAEMQKRVTMREKDAAEKKDSVVRIIKPPME